MFRHRRPLRRWAIGVLLLWLFGVAAGVANACVLPIELGPGGKAADAPAVVCPDHAGIGSSPATPNDNCRQFCDQEKVSIRPLKTGLDDVQLHALALPVHDVVLRIATLPTATPWTPLRSSGASPPIPIVFLRLTL